MRSRLLLASGCSAGDRGGALTRGGTHGQPPTAPPKNLRPEVISPTPIGASALGRRPGGGRGPRDSKPAPFDRFTQVRRAPRPDPRAGVRHPRRHGVA